MLDRLLSNLYMALNRDPQPAPAISITVVPIGGVLPSSYFVHIDNDTLQGTVQIAQSPTGIVDDVGYTPVHTNLVIDLTQYTLSQLAAYLSSVAGFTSAVVNPAYANISATALIEGSFDLLRQPILNIYTSLLWAIVKPMAAMLQIAANDVKSGLTQAQPMAATGLWLSTLGDLYGIERIPGETDSTFRMRILYEVIKPKVNNVGMEEYLKWSLGLTAVSVFDDTVSFHIPQKNITDVYVPFRFYVQLEVSPDGGLPADPSVVHQMVQRIKAWGTIWVLLLHTVYTELYPLSTRVVEQNLIKMRVDEQANLANAESWTLGLRQRYTESLGDQTEFLFFDVYKDTHNTIISSIDNQQVTFEGDRGGYVPWVTHILDLWNDSTRYFGMLFENYNSLGVTAINAMKMMVVENATFAMAATESYKQNLLFKYNEIVPRPWKPFRFDDYAARFDQTIFPVEDIYPVAPAVAYPGAQPTLLWNANTAQALVGTY